MRHREPLRTIRRHEHRLLHQRVAALGRLERACEGGHSLDRWLARARDLHALEDELTRIRVELIRRGC